MPSHGGFQAALEQGIHYGVRAAKSLTDRLRQLTTGDLSESEVLDLYAKSHTIFTCVNIRAENVANVPFRVVDSAGNEIDNHPLAPVFASTSNFKTVMRRTESAMSLVGSNLILPQPTLYGGYTRFGENLRWVNPRLWHKQVDADGNLLGFQMSRNARLVASNERTIPANKAIYMHGVDMSDDWEGIAPGEVAARAAGAQDEKWQTVWSYFYNRAIPANILQAASDNTTFGANEENSTRLQKLLDRMFGGSKNAGRTLVSPERLEHIAIQSDMDKLALDSLSPDIRQAICEAFQIPSALLTFDIANFKADNAIQFWYSFWLKPRAEWYAEIFSHFFTQYTHEEVIIEPDFGDIIQEQDQTDVIDKQLKGGIRDYYSAAVAVGEEAPIELKGLYHVDGIGPVPLAELPNVWKIKLNVESSGTPLSEVATDSPESATGTPLSDVAGDSSTTPPDAPENAENGTPLSSVAKSETAKIITLPAFVPDNIYKEISIAARKGADFVADKLDAHTALYIKSMCEHVDDQAAIKEAAKAFYLSIQAQKALQATRIDYELAFEDILAEAIKGNIDRRRFGTLLRNEIKKYIRLAYIDGLTDGGIADAELTDDDEAAIKAMAQEQSQYVSSIGETLFKGDGISEAEANGKPAMWWNKSIYPAYTAGLQSAAKNGYFEWVLNPDKENCKSCQRLNGQIHRMRDYTKSGWLPKSSKLECGGFACGCELIPRPNGKASGRLPSATKHDHNHDHTHTVEPVEAAI